MQPLSTSAEVTSVTVITRTLLADGKSGIDAEAWDLGETLHRSTVGRQQVGHLLSELD